MSLTIFIMCTIFLQSISSHFFTFIKTIWNPRQFYVITDEVEQIFHTQHLRLVWNCSDNLLTVRAFVQWCRAVNSIIWVLLKDVPLNIIVLFKNHLALPIPICHFGYEVDIDITLTSMREWANVTVESGSILKKRFHRVNLHIVLEKVYNMHLLLIL